MAIEGAVSYEEPSSPLLPPWAVLVAGLASLALGIAWLQLLGTSWPAPPFMLIFGGLVAIGAALALRLGHRQPDGSDQLACGAFLAIAAVAAGAASLGLDPWDSAILICQIFAGIAVVGAVLVCTGKWLTMAVVGLLIAFHFGGILTAVASVPPKDGPPAFYATYLATYVYRHYLALTNLNNGYHFYSPDPGPVALLWFRVSYADGSARWVRIPDHAKTRNGLETRRLGALATTAEGYRPVTPNPEQIRIRTVAGDMHNPPILQGYIPLQMAYRPPTPFIQLLLKSCVRHVAKNYPSEDDPSSPVTGIKVYRASCRHAEPDKFQQGIDPRDPSLYTAYYMGDYDAQGNFKPTSLRLQYGPQGEPRVEYEEPFLFWHLPIQRFSKPGIPQPPDGQPSHDDPNFELFNFVNMHAGDKEGNKVP
jgi:hypothetical protein